MLWRLSETTAREVAVELDEELRRDIEDCRMIYVLECLCLRTKVFDKNVDL